MQKLVFENGAGKKIDLTSDDFGITSWSGYSENELNIQTQKVPFNDGSVFLDALYQDRTLSNTLAINDDGNLEKRYKLKRLLISTFNAKLGEGWLYYSNDFISKKIKVIPQLPVFSNKNLNDSGTLKCNISFYSCSPYWEDVEETEDRFEITKRAFVENEGDADTDADIEIATLGVVNPVIRNLTTNKKIKLNGSFYSNIHIDTTSGNKKIYDEKEVFNIVFNSSDIYSIAYSEELNLFIAVGDNNIILSSKDGINWKLVDLSLPYTFKKVVYIEKLNQFMILAEVYSNGYVLTSSDGINWTSRIVAPITSYHYKDIVYSEELNLFVISVDHGTVYTSPDGVTWTSRPAGTSSNLNSIIYSDKLNSFIVVGNNGTIIISSDGITWTSQTSGTSYNLNSIIYSDKLNLFVVVGSNGTILTSSDGVTWTSQTSGTSSNLNSIIYSDKLNSFITVGSNGTILTSSDGVTWTSQTSGTNRNLNTICWAKNLSMYITAGTKGILLSTENGTIWNIIDSGHESLCGGCYSDKLNLFVVVGNNGTILTSSDGVTWTSQTSGTSYNLNSILYSKGLNSFITVGSNGTILTSSDGITWTSQTSGTVGDLLSIAFSEELNLFVIAGYSQIITSSDSINWEIQSVGYQPFLSVTYSDKLKLFVIVSYDGIIRSSDDGINWITRYTRSGVTFREVIYSEELNLFITTGDSGIYKSSDGITWKTINTSIKGTSVTYSEYYHQFILTSSTGGLYKSYNGVDFPRRKTLPNGIRTVLSINDKVYFLGGINLLSSFEDNETKIENLSDDSNMNFNLIPGKNEIIMTYDDGYAVGFIRHTDKYLGV